MPHFQIKTSDVIVMTASMNSCQTYIIKIKLAISLDGALKYFFIPSCRLWSEAFFCTLIEHMFFKTLPFYPCGKTAVVSFIILYNISQFHLIFVASWLHHYLFSSSIMKSFFLFSFSVNTGTWVLTCFVNTSWVIQQFKAEQWMGYCNWLKMRGELKENCVEYNNC